MNKVIEKLKQKMTKKRIIILVVVLVLLILGVIGGIMKDHKKASTFTVSGQSMEPALSDGDTISINKDYTLDRFDVVVFKFNDTTYVKRVIGLPNETVVYSNNKLYINDKLIEDPYNDGNTEDFSITLKDGEFYCLGDNRAVSTDSRKLGRMLESYIIGEMK